MKTVTAFILFIFPFTLFGQTLMKETDELINKDDPGWPIVQLWIDSAKNKVEILPRDSTAAKIALYKTQVTTRSPMGSIIYQTGGLLIDNGWIRILGSGSLRLNRSLPDWNKGKSFNDFGERPSFLLIADDAIGGYFAINAGFLAKENIGKVYYLSPDNLEWEFLDLNYSEFLLFCFNGNLNAFYEKLRWQNWKEDVAQLTGDKVYFFYPFLWTKEGKDISKVSRKIISIEEHYSISIETRKQLGIE